MRFLSVEPVSMDISADFHEVRIRQPRKEMKSTYKLLLYGTVP